VLVGALMLGAVRDIEWADPLIAIPAFLTLVTIPLTYSIANGLSFGMIAYALLQLGSGRARREDWMLYLLAALFIARFIYMGKN